MSSVLEENEALKSKIHELQQQLERKKKEVAELEARNKGLGNQIDKLKNGSSAFEEEKQKLLAELKKLKDELSNSQVCL